MLTKNTLEHLGRKPTLGLMSTKKTWVFISNGKDAVNVDKA
jgi:hypothetical protein